MSFEENKDVCRSFFAAWTAGNDELAAEYLADDVVWRTMGVEGEPPLAGTMDKEGICGLIRTVKQMMPDGLQLNFKAFTCEGDRVAAEVEGYGELTDGRLYTNLYHFLFVVIDGKITVLKEYCDTIHTKKIFGG